MAELRQDSQPAQEAARAAAALQAELASAHAAHEVGTCDFCWCSIDSSQRAHAAAALHAKCCITVSYDPPGLWRTRLAVSCLSLCHCFTACSSGTSSAGLGA